MKALVTRGKVIRYTHKWSSFKYRGSWPGNLEHQSSVSALTHTVQLALANRYLLKFKVQVRRMTMFPAARVRISPSLDMDEPLISSEVVKLLILDLAVVAFIQTVGSSLKLTHVFLTVAYIILIQCVNEH